MAMTLRLTDEEQVVDLVIAVATSSIGLDAIASRLEQLANSDR